MRAVLVLLVISTTAHASPQADEVAAVVQKSYSTIPHLQATFHQEVVNPTFGTTKKSEGSVWLARPMSMHWTYVKKAKPDKEFVSDGGTFWMVDHMNMTIDVASVSNSALPASASFLLGDDLRKTYDIVFDASGTYGAKGDVVLSMTPKKPRADLKKMLLVVSDHGDVKESIVIDTADVVNHIVFDAPDTKTDPPKDAFVVDPKKLPTYQVTQHATPRPPAAPTKPGKPARRGA